MMLYFKFILIFYVSLIKAEQSTQDEEGEDYCGISGPEDNIRKWWKREIGSWIFKEILSFNF